MRRLFPLLAVAILATRGARRLRRVVGGDDDSAPTGADDLAQKLRAAGNASPECQPPQGASRWGCSVGSYRCQGVVTAAAGRQLREARAVDRLQGSPT